MSREMNVYQVEWVSEKHGTETKNVEAMTKKAAINKARKAFKIPKRVYGGVLARLIFKKGEKKAPYGRWGLKIHAR